MNWIEILTFPKIFLKDDFPLSTIKSKMITFVDASLLLNRDAIDWGLQRNIDFFSATCVYRHDKRHKPIPHIDGSIHGPRWSSINIEIEGNAEMIFYELKNPTEKITFLDGPFYGGCPLSYDKITEIEKFTLTKNPFLIRVSNPHTVDVITYPRIVLCLRYRLNGNYNPTYEDMCEVLKNDV